MEAVDGKLNHETGKLEFSLDVPFPSEKEAQIALNSLSPDKEPRKGGIHKELRLEGNTMTVHALETQSDRKSQKGGIHKELRLEGNTMTVWSADEARILRVSVNSFMDHLSLVLETIHMFGPPVTL